MTKKPAITEDKPDEKPDPAPPGEVEGVPLAVITRDPSDQELLAELEALGAIAQKRALRGCIEYDHVREHIANAALWLRRVPQKPS